MRKDNLTTDAILDSLASHVSVHECDIEIVYGASEITEGTNYVFTTTRRDKYYHLSQPDYERIVNVIKGTPATHPVEQVAVQIHTLASGDVDRVTRIDVRTKLADDVENHNVERSTVRTVYALRDFGTVEQSVANWMIDA
jgi:hypothetical protein